MHEYSIASSLLQMAEEHARSHAAKRVLGLRVRVGELAGVEPELLETAWTLVRERSPCEGARLEISRVAARWACVPCGAEPERGAPLLCTRCGGRLRLCAGDELILDRIEMEASDV